MAESAKSSIKLVKKRSHACFVNFSNGRLKPDAAESAIKFRCFQGAGPKDEEKQTLVAESNQLTYVGKNYGPTASKSSTYCKYMLAVCDKKRHKVQLYDAQLFNMKPMFEEENQDESEESDLSFMQKNDRLTAAFGSIKKRRAMEARHKNKLEQKVLETAVDDAVNKWVDRPGAGEQSATPKKDVTSSPIPPYDLNATQPEDVYKLDDIISSVEYEALQNVVQNFFDVDHETLATWKKEESYPSYILAQLSILPQEAKSRRHKACCLTYLTYMMHLFRSRVADLRKKDLFPREVPDPVQKALLNKFTLVAEGTTPGSQGRPVRCMPARLKDSLASHMLVLCLILENCNLDFSLLMKDLRIGQQRMMTYLRVLGCKVSVQKVKDVLGSGQTMVVALAQLRVPLKFPEVTTKNKKERR